MPNEIVYTHEFAFDLDEVVGWYNARQKGLGDEFLTIVDECVQGVARMPEMYAMVWKDYRRAMTKRFPYSLIYKWDGARVTLYALMHSARGPATWRKRIGGQNVD